MNKEFIVDLIASGYECFNCEIEFEASPPEHAYK